MLATSRGITKPSYDELLGIPEKPKVVKPQSPEQQLAIMKAYAAQFNENFKAGRVRPG